MPVYRPDRCRIHLDAVGGIAGDIFVACSMLPICVPVLADVRSRPAVMRASGTHGYLQPVRAWRNLGHGYDHHHYGAGSFSDMVGRIRAAALRTDRRQAVAILTLPLGSKPRSIRSRSRTHFHEIADWDRVDVVLLQHRASPARGGRSLPLPGGGLSRHSMACRWHPRPRALPTGAWRDDGVGGERVTPNGAAIAARSARRWRFLPAGRLVLMGTGAGTNVASRTSAPRVRGEPASHGREQI